MLKLSKNTLGMLIAKYRSVLLRMRCKQVVVLVISGLLLAVPVAALAAEYHVGAGQAYVTLEALRAAAVDYADGDTVILHQDDASLTAPLDFGGKAVTVQGGGSNITLSPSANNIRLFTAGSGGVALAPGLAVEGFVNTAAGDAGRGGAIRVENGASVDARAVTFKNNQAASGSGGGAVYVTGAGSNLKADGALFQGNTATNGSFGGALRLAAGASATADNAQFFANSADQSGGAAFLRDGSTLSANDVAFTGNLARWGGAVYLYNSTLTANNARFSGNQANEVDHSGGFGGAINLNGSAMTAHNAVFTGNSAGVGGGALNIYNGRFTGDNTVFTGNASVVHGGAAYLDGGGSFIADGAFFGNNQAAQCGGALYVISVVHDEATGTDTSGVPSEVTLNNVIFDGNQAGDGGAAFVGAGGVLTVRNAQFLNNTAAGAGGAISLLTDVGDATVNIVTDAGRTTRFSGNSHYAGTPSETANAIAIFGLGDNTAHLNVDGEGTLDMRDPLYLMDNPAYTYDAAITKTGAGVWKLGGDSQLADARGTAGTTFTVNAGTLDLYKDAKITMAGGSFTLAGGATLISRGGNAVTAPTLSLGNNSTLGFDLTGIAAGGGPAALTLTGSTLNLNPAGQRIDILALNGSGVYNLVSAAGISAAGKTLTLRGESFGNTRVTGSLNVSANILQLTTSAQNGVMQWNGGDGDWNATDANWIGRNTSGAGGVDLSGETKFLHGDAVVFDNIAGGNISIQAGGVQVAARPDGSGGTNPGLIIANGNWNFTGGALDGGGIRFAGGGGGIAFASRSLTQRITVDSNVTATVGALDGHTVTFNGMSTGSDGAAIYGGSNAKVILSGGGSLNFTDNTARYGGAVYANKNIDLSGGANSFTGNQAQYGGAIYADAAVTLNNSDNTFTGNAAINGHGGAISTNTATFSGGVNRFEGNTAKYTGGAILATDITFDGSDNTFTGNASGTLGGAISADTVTFSGSGSFTGNKAGLYGGAIYAYKNVSLHARDADIRFEGNRQNYLSAAAPGEANAVYLSNNGGGKLLSLAASAGKSVLFFDPVASSNTMTNLIVSINPDTDNTGSILFDKYQSDIYGSTTVSHGALSLTNGAIYGVTGNAGSFTLENGARLSVDAAGGAVNAGAVTLKNGSVTAVDTSGGKLLTLNGNVSIDSGAALDVQHYSTGSVDAVTSNNAITGGFTKLLIGGVEQSLSTPSLDSFVNTIFLSKTNADKTITVKQGGLVWNNTDPGTAHGTFKVETDYTLGAALADNTNTAAHAFGWDGKTLTKTGEGSLTLTGANSYSGGTVISAGTLTVNSLANLGSGGIVNNAALAFHRSDPTAGQTINLANRYSGTGAIGLQASLTATAQWSDLLQFASAPQNTTSIYFRFTDGSSLSYLREEGLHFAELAAADGTDASFALDKTRTTLGANELSIKTTDNQNYYLNATFNPSAAKVYSETAAGAIGQAAGMHGQETFKNIGQAAAGAGGGVTGVYAGSGRGDVRHNSGSHADVKGNNFALALAWENGDTTWGLIGQKFNGSYITTHSAQVGGAAQSIHSNGDLRQHDFGLFAEYRPDDSGRYWQGLIKAGKTQNDFRADNANGGSSFRSGRGVFGLSAGGGYIRQTAPGRSLETYQHLIYTRVGTARLTDSLGQDIRFHDDDSVRLLAGLRWILERAGKPGLYAGAALDYECSGKTSATIDGNRADSASLQGLTGILELGFSAKQSAGLTIDGAVYGYVGKKEGISGSLTLNKRF